MGNSLVTLFLLTLLLFVGNVQCNPNYREALAKSLLFFQGQRSGRLSSDQQIKWRSNSGLFDGRLANVTISFYPFNIFFVVIFSSLLHLLYSSIVHVFQSKDGDYQTWKGMLCLELYQTWKGLCFVWNYVRDNMRWIVGWIGEQIGRAHV